MFIAIGFGLFAAVLVQGTAPTAPRTTVREATAAVEAGRVLAARDEWTALSSRDSATALSNTANCLSVVNSDFIADCPPIGQAYLRTREVSYPSILFARPL